MLTYLININQSSDIPSSNKYHIQELLKDKVTTFNIVFSKNLLRSDINRFLSHYHIWNTAPEGDLLIIENQIILNDSVWNSIENIQKNLPSNYQICYLYLDGSEIISPDSIISDYLQEVEGQPSAYAYFLSNNARKIILKNLTKVTMNLDKFLTLKLIGYQVRSNFLKLNNKTIPSKIGPYIIGQDIDEIVCINLESRQDRRDAMLKEFKDYPFSFYTAKKHIDPVRGCLESHINVIKYAKGKNYQNILILEDDLKIVKDLKTIPPFPDNWDMIYLGGLCTHVTQWGEWIKGHIYCDQAYLVPNRLFDEIIEKGWVSKEPLDKFYTRELHTKYNCYIQKESHIVQIEGYSDIDQKDKWKDFKWPKVGEMFPIP